MRSCRLALGMYLRHLLRHQVTNSEIAMQDVFDFRSVSCLLHDEAGVVFVCHLHVGVDRYFFQYLYVTVPISVTV